MSPEPTGQEPTGQANKNIDLTLIYAGGGAEHPPWHFSDHISQTVKATLTKFSDILRLPIPLDLSLFGAKSDV